MVVKSTGCCKPFAPKPWDGKVVSFADSLFVERSVLQLVFIPLNMDSVMREIMDKVFAAKAQPLLPVMLYENTSPFTAKIHIRVSKPIAGEKTHHMKGRFLSKVYEGDYSKTGSWMSDFKQWAGKKGADTRKIYSFYTTCPACAKAYGKNYVVLLSPIGGHGL